MRAALRLNVICLRKIVVKGLLYTKDELDVLRRWLDTQDARRSKTRL